MSSVEVVYGVTLFCSLALLYGWKRRRDEASRRISRGLRGYVSPKPLAAVHAAAEDEEEDGLIVA